MKASARHNAMALQPIHPACTLRLKHIKPSTPAQPSHTHNSQKHIYTHAHTHFNPRTSSNSMECASKMFRSLRCVAWYASPYVLVRSVTRTRSRGRGFAATGGGAATGSGFFSSTGAGTTGAGLGFTGGASFLGRRPWNPYAFDGLRISGVQLPRNLAVDLASLAGAAALAVSPCPVMKGVEASPWRALPGAAAAAPSTVSAPLWPSLYTSPPAAPAPATGLLCVGTAGLGLFCVGTAGAAAATSSR